MSLASAETVVTSSCQISVFTVSEKGVFGCITNIKWFLIKSNKTLKILLKNTSRELYNLVRELANYKYMLILKIRDLNKTLSIKIQLAILHAHTTDIIPQIMQIAEEMCYYFLKHSMIFLYG